jgi:hypothetical protein
LHPRQSRGALLSVILADEALFVIENRPNVDIELNGKYDYSQTDEIGKREANQL